MSKSSSPHLATIRAYLDAIERRAPFEEIAGFYTDDVVQQEFPNRFVPEGATRGPKELGEAAERGRKVIVSEKYEILHSVGEGASLALELQWTGVLAIPVGKLKAGEPMKARFGVFFTMRDGKIARQHNYDCFDAF